MEEAMFGRVIVPFEVGGVMDKVEIGFVPGFDLWGMIEEHDRKEGTSYYDIISEDNIIPDMVEWDVSAYRVVFEFDDEIRWEGYCETEEEAYMGVIHEWEDYDHRGKRTMAKRGNVYAVEVDLNDDAVIDGYYIELFDALWQEGDFPDLHRYFERKFMWRVMDMEEEDRITLMKVFYNYASTYYESCMTHDGDDPENIFDRYYEVVR